MRRGPTYSELLPPGTRVTVCAGKGEGTDQEWNGHKGEVVRVIGNQWAEIKMEKGRRFWPSKLVILGCSNLAADSVTSEHRSS